jgi:hypothetical protein
VRIQRGDHDTVLALDAYIVAGTAALGPNCQGHWIVFGGEAQRLSGEHVSVNEGRGPGLEVVPPSAPGSSGAFGTTTQVPSCRSHYGPTWAVRLVVKSVARRA